jgi:large subunit ribosomal protein L30e
MIDEPRALRTALQTGKVAVGIKSVREAVRAKKARLVVVASNCPDLGLAANADVRLHRFAGTNAELGAACGKPFSIAALAVLEPGESNILSV